MYFLYAMLKSWPFYLWIAAELNFVDLCSSYGYEMCVLFVFLPLNCCWTAWDWVIFYTDSMVMKCLSPSSSFLVFVFIFPRSMILPQKHKCPPLPITHGSGQIPERAVKSACVSSFCGCVTVCCMRRSGIPADNVSRFCHKKRQFGSHPIMPICEI